MASPYAKNYTSVHITPQLLPAIKRIAQDNHQCSLGEVVEAAIWEYLTKRGVYPPAVAPVVRPRAEDRRTELVSLASPRETPVRQPKKAS